MELGALHLPPPSTNPTDAVSSVDGVNDGGGYAVNDNLQPSTLRRADGVLS